MVVLPMYDVDDIRLELAKRRGRPDNPYSRQIVDFWIKKKLPMAEKVGGRYLLTEAQMRWLATQLGTKKKAKI
ncbi:hypothetical protein ES706_02182 [subsurface metagenome]